MDSTKQPVYNILEKKIRVYSETIWRDKVEDGLLGKWLGNFNNSVPDVTKKERLNVLYMLSKFLYYGNKETREMLKCIYRDKFQYNVIQDIRQKNGMTTNLSFINSEYDSVLMNTRFLGVGNPSESGVHLMYYFRQENNLLKDLFINSYEIFKIDSSNNADLADKNIRRYIFIDDFCGSGQQAIAYSLKLINAIKNIDSTIQVDYYPLFATTDGISKVKSKTKFDNVDAVFTLDDSYKCFEKNSRYFNDYKEEKLIEKTFAKSICESYGKDLFYNALGYNGCQLLLAFFHNTPDNTLPIFWSEENSWVPFFKRYHKK